MLKSTTEYSSRLCEDSARSLQKVRGVVERLQHTKLDSDTFEKKHQSLVSKIEQNVYSIEDIDNHVRTVETYVHAYLPYNVFV